MSNQRRRRAADSTYPDYGNAGPAWVAEDEDPQYFTDYASNSASGGAYYGDDDPYMQGQYPMPQEVIPMEEEEYYSLEQSSGDYYPNTSFASGQNWQPSEFQHNLEQQSHVLGTLPQQIAYAADPSIAPLYLKRAADTLTMIFRTFRKYTTYVDVQSIQREAQTLVVNVEYRPPHIKDASQKRLQGNWFQDWNPIPFQQPQNRAKQELDENSFLAVNMCDSSLNWLSDLIQHMLSGKCSSSTKQFIDHE